MTFSPVLAFGGALNLTVLIQIKCNMDVRIRVGCFQVLSSSHRSDLHVIEPDHGSLRVGAEVYTQ